MINKRNIIKIVIVILIVILYLGYLYYYNINDIGIYGGITYISEVDKYRDIIINNYDDYLEVIKYYDIDDVIESDLFLDNDYLVFVYEDGKCTKIDSINDVDITSDSINVYANNYFSCEECPDVISYEVYFIPISKGINISDYSVHYEYNTRYGNECN